MEMDSGVGISALIIATRVSFGPVTNCSHSTDQFFT